MENVARRRYRRLSTSGVATGAGIDTRRNRKGRRLDVTSGCRRWIGRRC